MGRKKKRGNSRDKNKETEVKTRKHNNEFLDDNKTLNFVDCTVIGHEEYTVSKTVVLSWPKAGLN